jgi:hypothetical protein
MSYNSLLLKQMLSVYPSMTSSVLAAIVSNFFRSSLTAVSLVCSFMMKICYDLDLNPALTAMQQAVSTLSPVSIHTCMPACLNLSIVSATSSYNLSSTPVTPSSSISYSSSSNV